ncbi:MAG: aspartate aminotransferase family protein [Alphaproteobacteria bacterium]|nr:aspartate aminotransferase family protein [Alphaproteobacteria bacterium]
MPTTTEIEDFRRQAHAAVEWMADYLAGVERYPVRAQVAPGDIAARLPAAPPETGETLAAIIADIDRIVMPGITHWQHPMFFAYFPANTSPPSVLAEMFTAAIGAQCMIWQTSPAATEIETRVLDWLRQLLGLPEGLHGVIQDTASAATLAAILTARERASGFSGNRAGLGAAPRLTAYCSAEAHSSVEKGMGIAGLGRENLRRIPVDGRFALRPAALEAAIAKDIAAGARPAIVVATLGTTGTSGFDPLVPIGAICQRHGIFLHVDAAWAGSALVLPEQRWMAEGMGLADSIVVNPHKCLFTNFDCSAHYVRDPAALIRTFTILPEYLKTRERDRVIDYRDWGIPLGRRFRALKLWFVLRHYGAEGLRARLRRHIALTQGLATDIAAEPDFELVVPPRLSLLCFRYRPAGVDPAAFDALNQRLLDALNDSGALYLTQTRANGALVLRVSIGQTYTEAAHVARAWAAIRDTARRLSVLRDDHGERKA